MKTAISIPDEVFESAEKLAKQSGVSRSELYVTALREFLKKQRGDRVMEQINEVYGEAESKPDPVFQKMQLHTLRKDKW